MFSQESVNSHKLGFLPGNTGARLFTIDVHPFEGAPLIRLKDSFSTRFLELSRWFSTHIRHMRDLKLSSLRPGTMSIDWYKLGCLQYPSFDLVAL